MLKVHLIGNNINKNPNKYRNFFFFIIGTIVNDDFPSYQRRRSKREIIYDDFNEPYTEKIESYSRPARDLSWFQNSFIDDTVKGKRTENNEYYVEILIVVDKHMYKYHRTSDDLIHYILTLMSHVSDFFLFIKQNAMVVTNYNFALAF